MLLTGEGPAIMPDASMVNLLAFFEGMTLDLMMDLPTGAPSAENALSMHPYFPRNLCWR